jgi:kynurenine 3-monooxygenase
MAIYLHRRGYSVDVYERRPDMRLGSSERGRSVNMTLSSRGYEALLKVGLEQEIEPIVTPLKGRVIHTGQGTVFQAYGTSESEVLHSVKRDHLNLRLLEAAERLPNVNLFFEQHLVNLDKKDGELVFRDVRTGDLKTIPGEVVIGADGTFSAVRQQMFRGEWVDYHQESLSWGYKELTIPAQPDGCHPLRRDGLHIWARDHCLLIAIPNTDGSFTCTFLMPFEGKTSFNALHAEDQIAQFFAAQFEGLEPFIPTMVQSYLTNAAEGLVTTRCAPWYYRDRVVLIGDACHSVYPFYGQGMNAALEDCRVLDECIGQAEGDWEAAFRAFQGARKVHTDVLADLSKQNFVELSERVKSHRFIARKKIELLLNRLFPTTWIPLYTLVSHTTMPYADAVKRVEKQNRRANLLGLNVAIGLVASALAIKESCTGFGQRFAGGKSRPALLTREHG